MRSSREGRWGGGKTLAAVAVVAAIGLAAVTSSILGALGGQNPTSPSAQEPTAAPGASGEMPGFSVTDQVPVGIAPKVDYVIDLNTGVMTPLPEAIIRSVGQVGRAGSAPPATRPRPMDPCSPTSGPATKGAARSSSPASTAAGVRQVTHDPRGATSPAWSPDGTMIAYKGYGGILFVLDVATGESTPISDAVRDGSWAQPQFTPDGSSLLYTDGSRTLQRAPDRAGRRREEHCPDRSGRGHGRRGERFAVARRFARDHDGQRDRRPRRAPVRGQHRRHRNCDPCPWTASNPAGTWSPDGSRIVCSDYSGKRIVVVDIATGEASPVAKGSGAIWLDRHTLLVEVV